MSEPVKLPELSTVARAIKLLENGAELLKKNPYALWNVMDEIEEFWGRETGRIEPDDDDDDDRPLNEEYPHKS